MQELYASLTELEGHLEALRETVEKELDEAGQNRYQRAVNAVTRLKVECGQALLISLTKK